MRILVSCMVIILAITNSVANPPHEKVNPFKLYTSHYENVLGTSMEFKTYAFSQDEADIAEFYALQEIKRLNSILSAYDPNSEFSRWMKTYNTPVPVSPELYEVLNLFDIWKYRTAGALDASAEVISRLWKKSASENHIPSPDELKIAVSETQQSHWLLNPINQTATHLSKAPLILNSFAKSYIIKRAANLAMANSHVAGLVLNIGGDLVVCGQITEPIHISDPVNNAENDAPLDVIQVSNRAVATSGNYRRGELINGQWYSHIVDPRTGIPSDDILSATVIAPNATDAGALATAFNVMPISESKKLASYVPGVDYLIITRQGEKIMSPGWKNFEITFKKPRLEIAKNNYTSDSDYELVINLEINVQKEGFVKRPYVAVWAEDENHSAVRTIALWHERDRYLPELKSWYLKYRGLYQTDNSAFSTVSSATRSAGKYTVRWDGKDDKGNPVKPGKYIIKIEVSREHGTYQLIRQEIDLDEKPNQISLPGNIEISAVSLDYRKKN